ncbi:MAG: protein tyrosine kinase [Rubrivivax sp. SCN 71-131]|jgi:exopolysaccharide/PEP-CTERM locus tyrosine autokinase|nr:MAG: protein tyrosine kinase [Rubrivivax sp. SCN 71-131]
MSLIEQAAQRLAQLRQAGVVVPEIDGDLAVASPGAHAAAAGPAATPAAPVQTSRMVTLDLDALMAKGIVTPNAPRSFIADQYRVIKRPLITNAMNRGESAVRHSNLIMVTSALSGEGKSFTSINLAMSIAAELDRTVMLVDADVARPSVLKVLGLEPAPGLLEVLEGKADVAGTLLRTNVDKLTILPSGTPHPKATELLASEAMATLLDDIATRYADRIVIFDSPPLLLTTESRVLASHMGQIVVVVHAGRTLQADVQNALATIESCPIRLMLLNKARAVGKDAYGYGYGYGYGDYGYGYGHGYGYGYGDAGASAGASKA